MKNRTFGESRAFGPVPALLAALLFAAVIVPSAPSGAQTSRLIPLYSWWSSDNQDHLCTSDPAWAGSAGKQKGAYRLYRQEGYLYAPDGYSLRPLVTGMTSTAPRTG